MDLPIKEDSSENLYYTYNVTSDFLDFTAIAQVEETVAAETSRISRFIKLITSSLVGTLSFVAILSWDLICFSLAFLVFVKQKVFAFVSFLDISKNKTVRFLMWRRGVLFRPATHGGVLALGALAVIAGGIFSKAEIAAQDLTSGEAVVSAPNTPETIIPVGRPRSEVVKYTVKSGDTLSTVAEKFGISAESVRWANNKTGDGIRPGDSLNIPPVSGVVYKVAKGDTLASVAAKFSADKQTIVDYPFNYLDATLTLKVGQTLIVPNGSIPAPAAPKPVIPARSYPTYVAHGSGVLGWPVRCEISQYASWFHPAIDMACPYGNPVYSADSGRVIVSVKQSWGYGWHVIVDHGNGILTTYAHMSAIYVNVGANVGRGQLVGAVGTTGLATGPHLHFQVKKDGVDVNPLSLLP